MSYQLYHGDCLELLPTLPDASVDAIITDPPYGTTACKWDTVIPFEPMWVQLKRIIKPRGAIVLFGSQPFTSALVMSNPKMFKYCWIWQKNRPTGFQHAPNRPLMAHEDITVFSHAPMGHISLLGAKRMAYFPIGVQEGKLAKISEVRHGRILGKRPNQVGHTYIAKTGYPQSILSFSKEDHPIHPTQKPVALMEYLIRTYTNEGETVLDFTMGSGSTGVAAMQTGRRFIGIEKDAAYYAIAEQRIAQAAQSSRQLALDEVG